MLVQVCGLGWCGGWIVWVCVVWVVVLLFLGRVVVVAGGWVCGFWGSVAGVPWVEGGGGLRLMGVGALG